MQMRNINFKKILRRFNWWRVQQRFNPEPYKFPSEQIMTLKHKKTVLRQLQKQLTATKNLLSSLEPLPVKYKKCLSSLRQTIVFLEKQIKYMQQEMESVVQN